MCHIRLAALDINTEMTPSPESFSITIAPSNGSISKFDFASLREAGKFVSADDFAWKSAFIILGQMNNMLLQRAIYHGEPSIFKIMMIRLYIVTGFINSQWLIIDLFLRHCLVIVLFSKSSSSKASCKEKYHHKWADVTGWRLPKALWEMSMAW